MGGRETLWALESGLVVVLVSVLRSNDLGVRTSAGGARKCWRLLCGRRQETLVTDTADCPASVEVVANDHRG